MIMKKILFQINVPNHFQKNNLTSYSYIEEMYEVSMNHAKQYAKNNLADYYLVTASDDYKPASNKHLDFQKLKMYDFKDYDNILYLDCDYIIKPDAPNLFEICDKTLGVCTDTGKSVLKLAEELNIPSEYYFNAGLMHVTKDILLETEDILLKKYIYHEYSFDGQGILNKLFFDMNVKRTTLSSIQWNNTSKTFATYGDHYSGRKKRRWDLSRY